jgi:hypothetical protein
MSPTTTCAEYRTTMNSHPTTRSMSLLRPNDAKTAEPQLHHSSEPSSRSETLALPRTLVRQLDTAVRPQKRKASRQRSHRTYPGSIEMLAMLTLRPVFATPVPRYHVEPRAADGAILVHDRATSEQFVVYLPRFVSQFQAGHQARLWYLRLVTDIGVTPRSAGFPTAHAAVEALRAGVWSVPRANRTGDPRRTRCKIKWS